MRASYVFRRWGLFDWWYNKCVQLNCDVALEKACRKENRKVLAATANDNKDFGYPLITFCPVYFNLPSFDAVLEKLDPVDDVKRLNVQNLRNQG